MSGRWGLYFVALFHGKNFEPESQSILLGNSTLRNFGPDSLQVHEHLFYLVNIMLSIRAVNALYVATALNNGF